MQFDEIPGRSLDIPDGIVDSVAEPSVGQLPEEALDGVHSGTGGRRVAEYPSATIRQPTHDGPVHLGGVVVRNGVDRPAGASLKAGESDTFKAALRGLTAALAEARWGRTVKASRNFAGRKRGGVNQHWPFHYVSASLLIVLN